MWRNMESKKVMGESPPPLLKGPSQPHLCFCLYAGESLAIIFFSEHVEMNEITETTEDNETYFQEHNLQ